MRGVSFEWKSGERIALLGKSGEGKSVLLKCLLGLVELEGGRVWLEGVELDMASSRDLAHLREKVGMVFQNGALFDSLSVRDNVAFGLREGKAGKGKGDEEIAGIVDRMLARVGMLEHAEKLPAEISGGMRKRVALARAVVAGAQGMMYDEPTAGLDPLTAASIDALIAELNGEWGMGALVVTHEMVSVRRLAQKVIFLEEGKIVWQGEPEGMAGHPVTRAFLEAASPKEGRDGLR